MLMTNDDKIISTNWEGQPQYTEKKKYVYVGTSAVSALAWTCKMLVWLMPPYL